MPVVLSLLVTFFLFLTSLFSSHPGARSTVFLPPVVDDFISPNLQYLGTIPLDDPGVGARVVQIGKQRRLYVTGVPGLTIYDVTNPELPIPLGHLALPNWENEDVSVSRDGGTVLISEWTGTYLHVIDTRNPLLPTPVGFMPTGAGHTVECIDDPCNWVYGSEGSIIDLRDKTKPTRLAKGWAAQVGLRAGHNVERDSAGIVWTDTTPIAALDVRDPQKPRLIAAGRAPAEARTAYQHNNMRPRAKEYKPRRLSAFERPPTKGLRPGELLFSSGETVLSPNALTCNGGSGPFATYSIAGFERGGHNALELLDVLRPVDGGYRGGDPAVNALGCSSHWFTVAGDGSTVAAAWYEHGTRLLKVDPSNGRIRQIGFFQPVIGSASAAYWVGDSHVYVVDYERGIDILRYDPHARTPTTTETNASWLAKLHTKSAAAETERLICRLATQPAA